MYLKITPATARASLRSLARGKKPNISVTALAVYLIDCGQPVEVRHKDDSVRFLDRLYALQDPRSEHA